MEKKKSDFIEDKLWELHKLKKDVEKLKDDRSNNKMWFQEVTKNKGDTFWKERAAIDVRDLKGDVTIEVTTHSDKDGAKRQFKYTLSPKMREKALNYLYENRTDLENAFDKDIEELENKMLKLLR